MEDSDSDTLDSHDMVRLAAGHDAALNDLMDRHAQRLFHYLVRSLQDESDAADLAQETFVKVYQNRTGFDPKLKFSTWLYAIASNLVRSRFRWRTRHPQVSLDAPNSETSKEFGERFAADCATPRESLETNERAEAVRQAVAALPEELKLPLVLAQYEEKSHTEIAEILNCTAKAVEMRIYRARKQLKSMLTNLVEPA